MSRGVRYIDDKLSKADKSVFLKLSATYRYQTRPSKMGVYHRDSYGTTCLPGHMERFEQKEKKRTQEKRLNHRNGEYG